MSTPAQFYGRGISYPMRLGASGGLRTSEGPTKVEESIRLILGTQWSERVMRPTFGANLKSLMFAPNNEATAHLAQFYVEQALKDWEPRIDVMQVTAINDRVQRALIINIRYRLRATNDIQSMIYPFYLEQA